MSAPSFPLVEWITTWRCEGRCFYCYQQDKRGHAASEVSPSAVRGALGELGARKVTVTGGEPLLLDGVEEFALDCAAQGLEVELLTRRIPSKGFLERAASLRRLRLHVGVDTFEPDTAARMGSPLLSRSEIRLAAASGAALTVRTAATPFNSSEMPALLRELVEMGVRSLIVIFPQDPLTGEAYPLEEDVVFRLGWLFTSLLQEGINLRVQRPRPPFGPPYRRPREVCVGGRRSLTVFPDGTVGLCQHLPGELRVGSIFARPVVDTAALESFLRPSRSLFRGTACETCGLFERCNKTGRCWLSARRAGNLFGPDSFCPLAGSER